MQELSNSRYKISFEQTDSTANSATFRCTVQRINGAYFGYCGEGGKLLVTGYKNLSTGGSKFYNHWGFPERSNSVWGRVGATPSYYLTSGRAYDKGYGPLKGHLQPSFTFEETVPINRGNSRQGSVQIKAGVFTGTNTDRGFTELTALMTLRTLSIPKVSNIYFKGSVDSKDVKDRYIRLSGGMFNHSNYYTAKIYEGEREIFSSQDMMFEYNIPVGDIHTEETHYYKMKIFGKDSAVYYNCDFIKLVVEANSSGLYIKEDSLVKPVDDLFLKNVNTKNLEEVWVKIDGQIKRTVK